MLTGDAFRLPNWALRQHREGHVAQKRAAWRYHGSGARRYNGRDFGTRHHGEHRRRAVKGDASCARQIGPQDVDGRSRRAEGRLCLYKRPRPRDRL